MSSRHKDHAGGHRYRRSPKTKFAHWIAEALRRNGETRKLSYDPARFCITVAGGPALQLNNFYRLYQGDLGAGPPRVLQDLITVWFHKHELPASIEDHMDHILPNICCRTAFELDRLQEASECSASYIPLGDYFGIGLVYSLPTAKYPLTKDVLDSWGVQFDDLFRLACRNLRDMSKRGMTLHGPGVWLSNWNDNYDATRLALPNLIRNHPVRGDHVAIAPNRDTLIVTGSEDEAGLAAMFSLAAQAFTPYAWSLLPIALRLAGDSWVPYLPPPEHPSHQGFAHLQKTGIALEYLTQAGHLDVFYRERGENCLVVPFRTHTDARTHQWRSGCQWAEGSDCVLPRTQDVFFLRPVGELDRTCLGVAEWDRVRAVVGGLMEPLDVYPERYRVRSFPTDEQLAAIGLRELPTFEEWQSNLLHGGGWATGRKAG